jgi:hypothetical protein
VNKRRRLGAEADFGVVWVNKKRRQGVGARLGADCIIKYHMYAWLRSTGANATSSLPLVSSAESPQMCGAVKNVARPAHKR